jgi:hypothetical protein
MIRNLLQETTTGSVANNWTAFWHWKCRKVFRHTLFKIRSVRTKYDVSGLPPKRDSKYEHLKKIEKYEQKLRYPNKNKSNICLVYFFVFNANISLEEITIRNKLQIKKNSWLYFFLEGRWNSIIKTKRTLFLV